MWRNDLGKGALVVYIRENAKETEKVLYLKGLDPQSEYCVTNSDDESEAFLMTGADLMNNGFTVSGKARSALVFYIEKK